MTAANDALLRDFAIRAVKAQPLGYLHAVLGGLALAVEWPRHPYPGPGTVYFYYSHLTPYPIPADHSWVAGGTAYSDAVQYGHATPSRVVRPVAILIDGYQRVFYTYGPLFGLILLAGLGGVLRPRLRRRRLPRLAWSPRPGSRPRRNRSPGRGITSPARCPDRSAEAILCQFVSVWSLPYPSGRSRFVQRRSHVGEAGQW